MEKSILINLNQIMMINILWKEMKESLNKLIINILYHINMITDIYY